MSIELMVSVLATALLLIAAITHRTSAGEQEDVNHAIRGNVMSIELIVSIIAAILLIIAALNNPNPDAEPADGGEGENPTYDSIIAVCSTCSPELLAAKTGGLREAMRRLVKLVGSGSLPINPQVTAITFHLDGDGYCGPYSSGLTGNFSRDANGMAHVCLWDVEKENRSQPFTVENAGKINDQLLPVHEAMHGWFIGRQDNYLIQEPFCKLISFIIAELPGGPDYCPWFSQTPAGHPDALMKYLCQLGITSQSGAQMLQQLAQAANEKGSALTDQEFADLVSTVLGTDALPAFRAAGILP